MLDGSATWPIACAVFCLLGGLYVVSGRHDGRVLSLNQAVRLASFCFIGLVGLRMPALFVFDRVWAETGSLYFLHAYQYGPAQALIWQVSNYFDLLANIASAVAVLLGLHAWPAVDIVFGLAPLVVLPWVLASLGFLPEERIGLLLVIAGTLFTIHSGENFGTVLHAKGWGAIYAFLLLLSLGLGRPLTTTHRVLLFVLPLTGPSVVLLLFAFAGIAVVFRPASSYAFLIWTVPGVAVQLLCLLGSGGGTGLEIRPLTPLAILYGADMFVERVFLGLLTPDIVMAPPRPRLTRLLTFGGATAVLVVLSLAAYFRQPDRRGTIILLPVVIGHFIATVCLAVGGAGTVLSGGGVRYFFPTLCMVAALIVTSRWSAWRWFPLVVAVTVGVVIVSSHSAVVRNDPFFVRAFNLPWREQIEAGSGPVGRTVRTYPAEWSFQLPACGEHWCGR